MSKQRHDQGNRKRRYALEHAQGARRRRQVARYCERLAKRLVRRRLASPLILDC